MVSLSATLREGFLAQSEVELLASHLYLQASHLFEVRHYSGFAKKFKAESDEERQHFNQLIDYVTLRGDPVDVRARALPTVEWDHEEEIFEYFLAFERDNYNKLKALFAQTRAEADFDAEHLVAGLLEEQVKAVFEWRERVKKVKGYNSTPGLLWEYDRTIE
jgi:ferritin